MEEQEKIDIREHLIGWIDTFLEDGIVPQVVNPEAIRANYIPKSRIQAKIDEFETQINNYKTIARYSKDIMQIRMMEESLGIVRGFRDLLKEIMEDK